jgi:hypothetical protein
VIEAVKRYPDGASVEQLEGITKIPRRTLQRRLSQLVASGRLRATKVRRGRRYHAPAETGEVPEQLAVSDQGEVVRSLIRKPLITRAPVGYEPRFLEAIARTSMRTSTPRCERGFIRSVERRGPNVRRVPTPARS